VQEVEISVYPREKLEVGTAKPDSVAAMIQVRPQVVLVLTVTHQDFDRLWLLANSGNLRHAYFAATEPRYGKALATNVSFSNDD
jgi:hypothetical protein